VGVIDFHLHIGTRLRWSSSRKSYSAKLDPKHVTEMTQEISQAEVIDYLDSQAVDRAVVLPDYAPKTGEIPTNEFISGFCDGTDRLIPFGVIALNDSCKLADEVERRVSIFRCRGFKLLKPYAHFYPADPRLLPAYEVASAQGIPIMFRTGTSTSDGYSASYGGHPLLLDDVAKGFPRLKIVMCHGGYPSWCADAERMLRRHANCYIDISGIPPCRGRLKSAEGAGRKMQHSLHD
jgi:uncharacterized protein